MKRTLFTVVIFTFLFGLSFLFPPAAVENTRDSVDYNPALIDFPSSLEFTNIARRMYERRIAPASTDAFRHWPGRESY